MRKGEKSKLLTPHYLYKSLGQDEVTRLARYRELFRYQLDTELVDQIRIATNGNFAPGSQTFKDQVEVMPGRRVTPGKSGRPKTDQ
jgi:putative transposase